jgi:hypothetical protein
MTHHFNGFATVDVWVNTFYSFICFIMAAEKKVKATAGKDT